MARALVANNAYSTLLADITAIATSITLAVGEGSRFPPVSGTDYFYATLIDASNNLEIIKVLSRSGDVLTVQRGRDGTTARVYTAGDRIELRPVAALFEDKLSFGGGALTGPLIVPAGASATQVPQVQEVVKRSGDIMTGALTVPELKGDGGFIDIPTGNRIVSPDIGGVIAPGMIVQTGYIRTDTISTFSLTASAGDAVTGAYMLITPLDIVFTPKFASSKILLQYSVFGDTSVSVDATFVIERDGNLIGRNTTGTDRWYGSFALGYTYVDSRPLQFNFFYYDTPATTSAITYRLAYLISRSGAVAHTFSLNRPDNLSPRSQYEAGISQVMIMEIAQ